MFEYGYISWNEYMDVCMYVQASELHMSLNMTCFACFQLFKASLHNDFHAFYLCIYPFKYYPTNLTLGNSPQKCGIA